jgi:acetyl esterase/lipase
MKKTVSDEPWNTHENIYYGPEKLQFMDITIPKNNQKKMTAILFIHGFGVKMHYPTFLNTFKNEYIIGIMSYRNIMEKTPLPELLLDVDNAVSMLKTTASNDNISVDKIIIIGQSMGGAMTLLYSNNFLNQEFPIPIAFCVSIVGVSDFSDPVFINLINRQGAEFNPKIWATALSIGTGELITVSDFTMFGYSERIKNYLNKISAINLISKNSPPTIIAHDTNDTTVPYSNSSNLNIILNSYDVPHIFISTTNNLNHSMGSTYTDISTKEMRKTITDYNPAFKEKLIEAINTYINKYCE